MVTSEEVGRRIAQARQDLGLTQTELGRRLSRPRSHAAVSDIERGRTKLNIEELGEIARLLGKSLADFTGSAPSPSVVYRRDARDQSTEQSRVSNRAIEQFKQLARERARQEQEQSGP